MLPIAIAFGAGALAFIVSRIWPMGCRLIALLAAAAVLAGGISVFYSDHEPLQWQWLELTESVSLTVGLTDTVLGMIVVIGSAAFALLITIYSLRAVRGDYWEGKYYAYLLWALGGACIVGLADNLLVLLVGWEIVTLMLFLMVNQGPRDAKAGGAKTYGILGLADACLLLAVALLAAMEGGSANWSLSKVHDVGGMGAMGYVVYVLIMVAALAKAGAIPVHTWLPAIAKDAPTPLMAYLPAALDKLLGIYLLATLSLRMFVVDWPLRVVMMVIGAVTILAAVLMAMMQHNLKRLLSFHAVSQVGYMVLGIGTGTTIGVIGGLFHLINNAIYKSNLFLMSGAIRRATGTDEIEDMGGLARILPVTFVCGMISAVAISGIPPLNGFVSKWLVYQGTLGIADQHAGLASALVIVAVFGSALTLASFVKVMYSAFLSPAPKGAAYAANRPKENLFMATPMIVLAVACIVFGVFSYLPIHHILQPAIEPYQAGLAGDQLATTVDSIKAGGLGYWSATVTTGLILIGILLGLVFVGLFTWKRKVRIVRPFLAGEVAGAADDRFRVPGTHFYTTVAKLPVVGPLLEHGEAGAMDPYHWSQRHGNSLVQFLRRFHTGLISLYVAWCLSGLTIILIYLLLAART
jgi:formate hydrogenlyase subunit 3/multisubunit Na+/H+ antiporter MnhD subunit